MKTKAALVMITVLFTPAALGLNASLVDSGGNKINLSFDRVSASQPFDSILTSHSYADNSLTNPDSYIQVCNPGLEGEKLQLYYASESKNFTAPILTNPVQVPSYSGNCTSVNADISAFKANFPGKPFIGVLNGSSPSNLTKLNQSFRGDYRLGIKIRRLDGYTDLKVDKIEDEHRNTVFGEGDSRILDDIFLTVTDSSGKILAERKIDDRNYRNFEMLFEGGEKVYVNGMLVLETRAVNQCGSLNKSNSYYILNGSQYNKKSSCVNIEELEDSALNFANYTIDGDNNESKDVGECALKINNSERVSISGAKVQQYRKGICIYNSDSVNVVGLSSQANTQGVYSENSSSSVKKIMLENSGKEVIVNNSRMSLDRTNLESGSVTGYVENVDLLEVNKPPENPTENLSSMELFVNVTELQNGEASRFGFNFPPVQQTSLNPVTLYKFDTIIGETGLEATELETSIDAENRLITAENNITEFSIFGAYGEKIEGTGSGEGEGKGTEPEPEPEPRPEPQPRPQPQPTPVDLKLELANNSTTLQQGETGEINFTVVNNGRVPSGVVTVGSETRRGWISTTTNLSIPPLSERPGSLLIGVWTDEVPGEYEVPIRIYSSSGSVLDTETLEVRVTPRQEIHRLRMIDSPSFVSFEAGETSEVAFLVENAGDYSYQNITLETRQADNCIESVSGSHSLETGSKETLEYRLEISERPGSCSGVFVLNTEKKDAVGFSPVQIEIEDKTILDRATSGILPLILIIWTIITIRTVIRA